MDELFDFPYERSEDFADLPPLVPEGTSESDRERILNEIVEAWCTPMEQVAGSLYISAGVTLNRVALYDAERNMPINLGELLRRVVERLKNAKPANMVISLRSCRIDVCDCRDVKLKPRFQAIACRFGEEAVFLRVDFGNLADFRETTFGKGVDFRGAAFGAWTNFSGTTFDDRLDFRTATFGEGANFRQAAFCECSDFTGATFGAGADFDQVVFKERVSFIHATFGDHANFGKANFGEGGNFRRMTFGEGVKFDGVNFGERTSFTGTTFGKKSNFKLATFGKWTNFRGVIFGEQADFRGATFKDLADFGGANFGEKAYFLQTVFGDGVNFTQATFGKKAHFRGADFGIGANFEEAVFGEGAIFYSARFQRPNLKDAKLDRADLRYARGLIFNETRIHQAQLEGDAPDPWSQLRRAYTGPWFFVHLLLLLLFFAPFIANALTLTAASRMQEKIFDLSRESSEWMQEQNNEGGVVSRTTLQLTDAQELLKGFEQRYYDEHVHRPAIWLLVGGDKAWGLVFTAIVIFYNLLRGVLTMRVSRLRDAEERSSVTPRLVDYDGLCNPLNKNDGNGLQAALRLWARNKIRKSADPPPSLLQCVGLYNLHRIARGMFWVSFLVTILNIYFWAKDTWLWV